MKKIAIDKASGLSHKSKQAIPDLIARGLNYALAVQTNPLRGMHIVAKRLAA